MNKDLDDRLIPNGEYRDAQNVSVKVKNNRYFLQEKHKVKKEKIYVLAAQVMA